MIYAMLFRRGTVSLIALGCAKAQVDAEVGLGDLLSRGYHYTPDPDGAETVIINTCSFITPAVEESVEEIMKVIRLKKEGRVRRVIVAGCLVDRYREVLMQNLPEVDAFYSSSSFRHWLKEAPTHPRPRGPELPSSKDPRFLLSPKSYAYLKIAEGCDRRCAFCTIPYIRGSQRSRPLADICEEARALAQWGVKEIILVSQDTVRWGRDLPTRPGLLQLLTALEQAPDLPSWIRLHYLYPERFPQELYHALGRGVRVLPYVDLPIQHASDTILQRMRRGYNQRLLREIWEQFRKVNPDLVLRTTVIVGHPGETEKEFQELMNFLQECPFEWVGIFPYSPEEGTDSVLQPDPVPEDVRMRRVEMMEELCRERSESLLARFIGREMDVLVDGRDPKTGEWVGRTFFSSPDVDGRVILPSYSGPSQRWIRLRLEKLTWPDFLGRPLRPFTIPLLFSTTERSGFYETRSGTY